MCAPTLNSSTLTLEVTVLWLDLVVIPYPRPTPLQEWGWDGAARGRSVTISDSTMCISSFSLHSNLPRGGLELPLFYG